jgi:hypothetical protein
VAQVDLLFARDALLHSSAINRAVDTDDRFKTHKQSQSEGITEYLTAEHSPDVVQNLWRLRRDLEKMSMQLYAQFVAMSDLVTTVVEQATMYFSQRRPRELANFKWTIDAKDPLRVTTQERWWRETLGPLLESRCRHQPLQLYRGSAFDYRFFEKAYMGEKTMWHPEKPRERVTGYDIERILSDRISFTDSRSDILIQAVDILANHVRRVLNGKITDVQIARVLGRLQINQRPAKGIYQSVRLLGLSKAGRLNESDHLGSMIRRMSLAGRSMRRPEKPSSTSQRTRGLV